MINAKIKNNVRLPKFVNLSKELAHIANRIIVPDIQSHIDKGQDITGKRYAPLASSTIRAKGGDSRKLIETGKLRSNYQVITGGNRVKIRPRASRRDVARYLQVEGVKSNTYGRRRFHFFDVSLKAEQRGVKYFEEVIRRLIRTNAR